MNGDPSTREIMDALLDFRDAVAAQFEHLTNEMRSGFAGVERRLDRHEDRIEDVERRMQP